MRPKVLEMGVASAIMSFNDGTKRLIGVMKKLKIVSGYFSELFCLRWCRARELFGSQIPVTTGPQYLNYSVTTRIFLVFP